ncbi:hypothetical protein [Mesorhizobium loti]|uniref:hypothetical protein n=1 Tax=Rhizobium loti TaxID=381 RepID=UPI0004791D21|nr:hypothetical protein [Mesorhizobium loti]
MAELRDPDLGSDDASALHHAAGKVLNDHCRYKEAMDHYKKGNRVGGHKFDLENYRRWVDAMIETFTPELFASRVASRNCSLQGSLTAIPRTRLYSLS